MKRGKFIVIGAMLALGAGCATAPEPGRNFDRGPDQVLGEPPTAESEDYEFAPPPRHPGAYGEVKASTSEVRAAPRQEREAGVVRKGEVSRLLEFGPSIVLEHVDTEPSYESGRFVGFMIVDFSDQAQWYVSPELRVGDVITHVNLVRLERPDDYLEAWNQLSDAEEIRIDFLRDGESQRQVWSVH